MNKNMGSTDKLLRLAVAVVLVALYVTETLSGVLGYVALGAAAIFTLTSIVSFCPLYTLLGINTCPVGKK